MGTIFEAITTSLTEGGTDRTVQLANQVAQQVENLSSISGAVANLIDEPIGGLTDLLRSVDELCLPDLGIGPDLASTLDAVREAVPSDVSSVLSPLVDGLAQLEGTVVTQVTTILNDALKAVLAIYELTQVRFGGTAGSASPGAAGPAGAGGAGPGGTPDPASPGAGAATGDDAQQQSMTAGFDRANTFLDTLPEQVDVKALLTLLARAGTKRSQIPFTLPVLDELGDLLSTLLAWESLDSAAILDQFGTILADLETLVDGSVDAVLGPLEAGLSTIGDRLHMAELAAIAGTLTTNLAAIGAAIAGGDLGSTGPAVDAIQAALAQHAAIRADLQADGIPALETLLRGLSHLAEDLVDRLETTLSVLEPATSPVDIPGTRLAQGWAQAGADLLRQLEDRLDSYVAWFEDLVNKVDLRAIQEPLQQAADAARAAVDELDNAMVSVTLEIQSLFGQVQSLLDQVDIDGIANRVIAAIGEFRSSLSEQLQSLLGPIRDAVEGLLTTIQEKLALFDPQQVAAACQTVIDALAGALQNETLVGAARTVGDALTRAGEHLQALSFTPLIDQVIAAIEEVTESLESIDESQLNPILRLALDAAVEILPDDVTALTDPLAEEFGRLIEEEAPMPQIRRVLDLPQMLLDQVNRFEPKALLGEQLSKPFDALVAQMEAFRPSRKLREPLEEVLDTLKQRLRESADPGQLIAPLESLFDQLQNSLDSFKPEDLVKPLEDRIAEVIANVMDALQFDQIMDQVDAALGKVQGFVDTAERGKTVLQRIAGLLDGFADPETQITSWIDPILEKVDFPAGDNPLGPALTSLSAALDRTRAADLSQRFGQPTDALLQALDAIAAGTLLIPVVQAYRGISRQALDALPGFAAEKAAILGLLDAFDPMQPDFAAPFQALGGLKQGIEEARADLQREISSWDQRFHSAGGVFAELRQLGTTPQQLRTMLQDTLTPQLIRPLADLLSLFALAGAALSPIISNLERLISIAQAKVEEVILGPDSLGGIRDAMNALVQRLENLNLGFITERLGDLFEAVKGKLDAVSPARLREAIEVEFDNLLDGLQLDLLFPAPADEADPLDQLFDELLADFRALHPNDLVVNDLQQMYEETVVPLLQNFDLTLLIQTLLERLGGLDEELKAEFARVDGAYQGMLQAVP